MVSSTSVPAPGLDLIRPVPPNRSIRPTIDSRTPRRSAGTELRVEAGAAISYEDLGPLRIELGVDRDLARVGRELGRVDERLAGGGDECLAALVHLAITDGNDLDRHAMGVLNLGGGELERGGDAVRGRRAVGVEEPRPQLALLSPGELRHLARVAGALLHQGQCLQNRVVEVGGQLGALLGPDPLGALAGEVAPQAPQERREDEREPGGRSDHREDDLARVAEDVVGGEEDQNGADHQSDPEAAAVERGQAGAGALGRKRGKVTRRPRGRSGG